MSENLVQAADYRTDEIVELASLYGTETMTHAGQFYVWNLLSVELCGKKDGGRSGIFWVHHFANDRHVISWKTGRL